MGSKVTLIITIVLFAYSGCGVLFLIGVKIRERIKAKKCIKEASEEISHIEVKHNEQE